MFCISGFLGNKVGYTTFLPSITADSNNTVDSLPSGLIRGVDLKFLAFVAAVIKSLSTVSLASSGDIAYFFTKSFSFSDSFTAVASKNGSKSMVSFFKSPLGKRIDASIASPTPTGLKVKPKSPYNSLKYGTASSSSKLILALSVALRAS